MTNPSAISIYEDSRHYLWIGTWGGLFRYDGYQFRHYPSIIGDSSSLSSQGVIAIAEDKSHRLWIAGNYGLNYFDRAQARFYQFYNNPSNSSSLPANDISAMIIDSKGRLWIGTYRNGIAYAWIRNTDDFTKHAPVFKAIPIRINSPKNFENRFIQSIYEDVKGNIWITTGDKLLQKFDESRQYFESYSLPASITEKANFIEISEEDSAKNCFWLCTRGAGILSWNKETHKIEQFSTNHKNKYLSFDIVRCIKKYNDNSLLVGTDGKGLSILDINKGEIANYKYKYDDAQSISSNTVYRILRDHAGNIWLATYNGQLSKINRYKSAFTFYYPENNNTSLNHKSVLSVIEDKENNLWIGTDGGGINILNRKNNSFKYLTDRTKPHGLTNNAIICLTRDNKDRIWAGTYGGGLLCYNKKTKNIDKYLHNPDDYSSIRDNTIWTIVADKNNNIWCVTLSGILEFFNTATLKFTHFDNNANFKHNYLIASYPTQMLIDSHNWLWITTTHGIIRLDLNKFDFSKPLDRVTFNIYTHIEGKNSPPSNNIYAMAEDSNGNIWFGTDEGMISQFNSKSGKFISIPVDEELLYKGIRSMIFDNSEQLWIGSNNGLWRYIKSTGTYIHYDESDGLQGNIFSSAIYKLKSGEICAGGPNGLNIFDPKAIPINKNKPDIVVTELKIFNQQVFPGKTVYGHIILKKSIEETQNIILPHSLNFFSIQIAALDFTNSKKNKYAYMLEGLDKQWNYVNADKREISYANLKPGKYLLKIKASNNDGIWNNVPRIIKIQIIPPWWDQLWLKIFVIILIIGLPLFYLYRKNRLVKIRQEELNKAVEIKTQELLEKNRILQEQQSQLEEQAEELRITGENLAETNRMLVEKQKIILEQSEKLQQSNEQLRLINASKDKFFSIIAHDLRNPFNVLIGLSDIMLRNYDNLPPEKIKRYSEIIYLSAKSGFNLLENLLQWSRAEMGTLTFAPAKIQLSSVVEETFDLLAGEAERKSIILTHQIDPQITVWADESMLFTIFRNLISNAIKFTAEKGKVTVDAREDNLNRTVQISVSDTGVGIPSEVIPNLFRIDINYTTKGTANEPGTGLGLILCKEFVEKNGGKIWVESKEKVGSTFYFTLPTE
jgi:signal transduction histidine kinase/streptogramin lyase